jgi:integrase
MKTTAQLAVAAMSTMLTATSPYKITLKVNVLKTRRERQYMMLVRRYLGSIDETRELETIPPQELNVLLARFFVHIRKKDGGVYEPSSLTAFQRSIQRYLNDKGSNVNILKDQEFAKSRETLAARKRELVTGYAKGNRPQATRELTEAEENLLFEQGLFGDHDAEVLQRTVWWVIALHFGFRARDESRKLKWGDICLGRDPETNNEVLVWHAERGSKTRHGDVQHHRAFNPTAQATNTDRCPVKLFKKFASHRPAEMKLADSPFFLAINRRRKPECNIWYAKSALGKNEIGKFLCKAAKAANLPGHISNHSVRKTCISRLMDAGVPQNYVAQLSGHKNLKSLDSYKSASVSDQRRMSLTLSRPSTSQVSTPQKQQQLSSKPTFMSQQQDISIDRRSAVDGVFAGASIDRFENCSFNFYLAHNQTTSPEVVSKKRRILISDDSDSN